jgi:REP element-mobilizing transposase RayT
VSTHRIHSEKDTYYFITFTCYKWLPLFEVTNIYDYLHFWFEKLRAKGCLLVGYVIMPNHLHLVVYVNSKNKSLNRTIAESKRFLAYEIVKRLCTSKNDTLIQILKEGVQINERAKGKKHQVFRLSFDAKEISEDEVGKALDYIHHNPVKGKWNLVDDFTIFTYSSAGFYENGTTSFYKINDFRNTSESSSSDSE